MAKADWQQAATFRWLTLLVTSGTLLCCALPILLVSMGFGAVVAAAFYNLPGLMFLAEHKLWTLGIAGALLLVLAWVVWRPGQTCPADPALAELCQASKRWNQRILLLSSVIWMTGFFFSMLLLPLRRLLAV
ncbi:MAG: hypothetical protein JKY89_02465 [Immundisolibacteraceae bacterium]|nr:hypothetical protein [Immundisolibacteraceae bacterium]